MDKVKKCVCVILPFCVCGCVCSGSCWVAMLKASLADAGHRHGGEPVFPVRLGLAGGRPEGRELLRLAVCQRDGSERHCQRNPGYR